jgi:site-specific recombinase
MENLKIYLNELSQVDDNLTLVRHVIKWLRPTNPTQIHSVEEKIHHLAQAIEANPEQATLIRKKLHTFLVDLRFLPLYSDTGILPRRNVASEFWQRIYNQLMPKPPVIFSAKNLLESLFDKKNDLVWVQAVPDESWLQLYRIFIPDKPDNKVERHLLDEALYALEMLSIWLAAEEMEDELLRLDPSIIDHDSDFIAQEREISQFVAAYRSRFNSTTESKQADAAHAWVMLQQCANQIKRFQQLALRKGSDLKLTYLLERLEQILARIRILLGIFDAENEGTSKNKWLALFRQLMADLCSDRSVTGLIRQTNHLLAKSVTNHASKTGEHYVTEDRHEYIEMLGRGLGAGVLIAIMALIKILISAMGLPEGWTTLWVSLNYGLGFVIIHMLHFTVATKQPAMTAAYIAEKLEHANNGAVNEKDLAQLIVKVGRSQFAAILGNVSAALPMALIIGLVANWLFGSEVMKPDKAAQLMQEQNPVASLALFYAAIAGIWLFVSGLVAGYFDNRSLYLDLPGRIRQHPLLERILPAKLRHRLADYISEHYGALWGNFFFGVMLGVTAYVGYLLSLPLDIRHVAFSVANVGYSTTVTWPGIWVFLEFVLFALLIGVVNLTVSFVLALNVAIRSRRIRLGRLRSIASAFWQAVRHRPLALIFPPTIEPDRSQKPAQP